MVTPNTLADIRTKVRNLTARQSQDQITDAQIDGYVNTYYLYDMPESLRLLKLKDVYTFSTVANQERYALPNDLFMTIEPPFYVGGQLAEYFQDLQTFYMQWPKINYIQQINVGNGANGPYIGMLTGTPMLQSINPSSDNVATPGKDIRVMISAQTSAPNVVPVTVTSAYDDGVGGWIDSQTGAALVGSINYLTGQYAITFSQTVPAPNQLTATMIPYQASIPRTGCFYQDQFLLRPVPDKAYIVEINGFRYPTALMAAGDTPELKFWWQLLAYGAARKILVDNGDYENAQAQEPYFLEQLAYVQRRTLKLNSTQRAQTIYSGQGSFPFSNLYPYI